MADETKPKGLTDKQIVEAISLILSQHSKSGGSGTGGGGGTAAISVGDIVGEIVLHSVGALTDVIAEIVTDGLPDVDTVSDVVGELVLDIVEETADLTLDIVKEVIVHLIVDFVYDLIRHPLDVKGLGSEGLRGALQERVERAKRMVALASPEQAAPSTRELADLRKAILKSRGKKK